MSVFDNLLYMLAYSLSFALVGLGMFLTTKVFRKIDLTCESSFALGGCIYGSMLLAGTNPILSLITAMFMGYMSGVITAYLINYIKLNYIIAGLLTAGGIQSLLIKLVEVKNINPLSFLGNLSVLSSLTLVVIIVGAICFLFYKFISSEYGLSMRTYGDGEIITKSMGIDGERILSVGLGLENMMCALSGALIAQIIGDFSAGMGNGCIIFGISSIFIGEKIFSEGNDIKKAVIGVIIGSVMVQSCLRFVLDKNAVGLGNEYYSVVIAIVLIMLVSLRQEELDYDKDGKKE